MTTLSEIRTLNVATDLVQSGLRLSIIVSLTGMSARPLRKLWLETHGKRAPNGKLPDSVLSFITNQAAAANISTFVSLHLEQHKTVETIKPEALLHSWRLFHRISHELDINACWYGLRDVRSRFVSFPRCSDCDAHFIFDTGSSLTSRCPFCGCAPMDS